MPSVDPPPQPPTHPDIPPFPSPSTFSILPDIYILLARLSPLRKSQSQSHSQTSQTTTQDPNSLTTTLSNDPSLEIKDLPTLIYPLRQKILKAKAAVQALPDMERSIREQEEEMRGLEGRVRGLRGRLGELGGIAGRLGVGGKTEDEDGEGMEGVEGHDRG